MKNRTFYTVLININGVEQLLLHEGRWAPATHDKKILKDLKQFCKIWEERTTYKCRIVKAKIKELNHKELELLEDVVQH